MKGKCVTDDQLSALLESDEIIVPYEGYLGKRHVDSFVFRKGDLFRSFNLVDDDRNFGPAMLVDSHLQSEEISRLMHSPETLKESIAIKEILICRNHFLSENHYGTSIVSLVLVGKDGKMLRLSAGGLRYSYDLVLESI